MEVLGSQLVVVVVDQDVPTTHFWPILEAELGLLVFFCEIGGYQYCKVQLIVLPQVVRHLGIEDQTIPIILILDHIDNLTILCFRNLLLTPLTLIESQIIRECDNSSLADQHKRGQAERRQTNDNPIFFHEVVHKLIIGKISGMSLQDKLMDLIDKIDSILEISHDGILRYLFRILHFLIIQEGLVEFDILLAHLG